MIGRLLIGLQADWHEVDPWGPLDAVVILSGLLCWGGAIWLFVRAEVHARMAVELAQWQIREADGTRVVAVELRGHARGARGLRRWIARRHAAVIPVTALAPRDRRTQLLIAARGRLGTDQERRASFGEGIAIGYAKGVRRARRAAAALAGAELIAGAAAVTGYVTGGGSSPLVRIGAAVFIVVVLSSPIVGRATRRGPNGLRSLAARLLPSLQGRDARLDVDRVAAMIRKPRLYDLWAELHPFPRAPLGSRKDDAFSRDPGVGPPKRRRCRS
jgi:hypothetical protein